MESKNCDISARHISSGEAAAPNNLQSRKIGV